MADALAHSAVGSHCRTAKGFMGLVREAPFGADPVGRQSGFRRARSAREQTLRSGVKSVDGATEVDHDEETSELVTRLGPESGDCCARSGSGRARRGAALGGILAAPLDRLYDVREVDVTAPPAARVLASVPCSTCGEPTMKTRTRRLVGRDFCVPCFDAALIGTAPVAPRPRG